MEGGRFFRTALHFLGSRLKIVILPKNVMSLSEGTAIVNTTKTTTITFEMPPSWSERHPDKISVRFNRYSIGA